MQTGPGGGLYRYNHSMHFELHHQLPGGIQAEWNSLLERSAAHVPFLRYEYQNAWWETRGGGEWPQAELTLVTARQDGRLIGIAPLFTAQHEGEQRLLLVGSIEVSDYLDLIAAPEDLPVFTTGLLSFLRASLPAWQRLALYNLLEDSPSLPALQDAAQTTGMTFQVDRLQHSPYIPLPGDWETYLSGIDKKQRHEIRRKMRRAAEMETPAVWYLVNDPRRLDEEIEDFLQLMAQDPQKAAFLSPAMRAHMHRAARCAFEAGCLHLAFLTVGGEKAAGYFSFDYLNRLWIYNSGLDRRFMEYSPGWVLLGHLLQWANENGRSEFDFMRGDEEYKYRFGAVDRFVVRALIG